ncbi:MAG: DUF5682 family protein [Granulosicoccus sp.]
MKIYGIRHHGPGCARSLLRALDEQRPDVILIEAPAEMDGLLEHVANDDMKPPLAALLYQTDAPQVAAFYPFARFSPEWQTVKWAHENTCELRSMDLPAAISFALQQDESISVTPISDPFELFARADGYSDGERWWNDKVEERDDSATFFDAILEAVCVLRSDLDRTESERTLLREAWMRRQIKAARRDGFENPAVVCGAWHAPALINVPKVSEDNALLKGLTKAKVKATWTPWSYERLTMASGYGAGIRSPGWYDHLWSQSQHPFTTWMTRAARLLRQQDLEGSSASIIEATRLAHSLAGLRGRPQPGLDESLEAMRTVFCAGDATPLSLLQRPLLTGERLGEIPDGIANLPLQNDIDKFIKRLRLKPTASSRDLTLDLREESAKNRSAFLHRLQALGIRYGNKKRSRSMGTFREVWQLQWEPAMVLDIVDASRFGNTLVTAAASVLLTDQDEASIDTITERLDLALLADLPAVAPVLVKQLDRSAASTTDALELMRAVPALVRIVRYGDVRNTDSSALSQVLEHLTTRIHIAMPQACRGMADEKAIEMVGLMRGYFQALTTLQSKPALDGFIQSLKSVANTAGSSPEPAGCATRLLYDANEMDASDTARLFSFALSQGNKPSETACWLEGFLQGSGAILVHDTPLLAMIDQWLSTLNTDGFTQLVPLLRRTFGQFSPTERSQIAQVIKSGTLQTPSTQDSTPTLPTIDIERAIPALITMSKLLNLPLPDHD